MSDDQPPPRYVKVRDIEPELLQGLGSFITKWAYIESLVSKLFAKIIGGQTFLMFVVTESVSQTTITDWIRTMIECRPAHPQALDEIRRALADVDSLRAERNVLVHGIWNTDAPVGSAIINTVKLDRSQPLHNRVITAQDLADLIHEELAVINQLHRILESVFIGPWPSEE